MLNYCNLFELSWNMFTIIHAFATLEGLDYQQKRYLDKMSPGPNTWESSNLQDSKMQLQLRLHLMTVVGKHYKGNTLWLK